MRKEEFALFLEDPTRESLREILKNNLGEQNNLDFKSEWPSAAKIAKHVLALANFGGGCLIVGVKEDNDLLIPEGVAELKDKTTVIDKIRKFIPATLLVDEHINLFDFLYPESEYPKLKGKKFQVLIVENVPEKVPFVSLNNGEGINEYRIYTRRGMQTVEASYEEIQKIVNRRIETQYSSTLEIELETHLSQLKVLYGEVAPYKYFRTGGAISLANIGISNKIVQAFGEQHKKENPNYPKENYEQFIARMINKKKRKIEMELSVSGIEE